MTVIFIALVFAFATEFVYVNAVNSRAPGVVVGVISDKSWNPGFLGDSQYDFVVKGNTYQVTQVWYSEYRIGQRVRLVTNAESVAEDLRAAH